MSRDLTDSEICLSCMECCKQIYTPMPWVETDELMRMKEFYTRIGCEIYEKRPLVCREYDGSTDPLMKETCKLPERKLIVLPGKGERV